MCLQVLELDTAGDTTAAQSAHGAATTNAEEGGEKGTAGRATGPSSDALQDSDERGQALCDKTEGTSHTDSAKSEESSEPSRTVIPAAEINGSDIGEKESVIATSRAVIQRDAAEVQARSEQRQTAA